MNWSATYVGRADPPRHCWDLVCQVYGAELGIELPAYDGSAASPAERAEVARLVRAEEQGGLWGRTPLALAQEFDVLIFRQGLHRSHAGVLIDTRHMLHWRAGQARVDRFTGPAWITRLDGVYRHVERVVQ